MVVLRDMRVEDIEDYVRWFTTQVGWMDWDAPWETEASTPEAERKGWTEYYLSVKDLPKDAERWKFEIEVDGRHVGWVCSYTDLGYLPNEERIPAVGIDVPEEDVRGQGVGTEALRIFIRYLAEHGHPVVYTQTWSGNERMMRVAAKLGFEPFFREEGVREVRGKRYDALTYRLEVK